MAELSYSEALLWLHDHIGEVTTATVDFDAGDMSHAVASYQGPLAHWSDADRERWAHAGEDEEPAVLSRPRDDLAGWYRIGDATVDLSGLEDAAVAFRHRAGKTGPGDGGFEELAVALDSRVTLRLTVSSQELESGGDA